MLNKDILNFLKSVFQWFSKKHIIYLRLYCNKIEIRSLTKEITVIKNSLEKFSNERLLVASFSILSDLIIQTLEEFEDKKDKTFKKPLIVLIQPMEKIEGGISETENAIFRDLGHHIGGSNVFIHESLGKLSDFEVREITKQK